MTQLVVTLPADLWWTSNQLRGSHHRWDAKARAVRLLGRQAALGAGAPPLAGPLHLHVFVGYPTAVRADPPNVAGTVAKHALDGIVESGLIPDDDSRVIVATTYSRETRKTPAKAHTLRFVFTEQGVPWLVEP